MRLERRFVAGVVPPEIVTAEARGDGMTGGTHLAGYAVLWNVETLIGGSFREVFEPGTLDTSGSVVGLFNHDPSRLLGRSPSTLKLTANTRGLRYSIPLDLNDPDHQSVKAKVVRGDLTGSSFAFTVDEDAWERSGDDLPLRRIIRAKLFDVGPVTYPAYQATNGLVHLS